MPFNPRRAFKIQVAGIATVVLSVAVVAVVLFSRWGNGDTAEALPLVQPS